MKVGAWSTSAGSNTATPPDGFPEGMAPSGVNDGIREVMAQIKTYANDAEWFDRDWTPTYVNANSFTVTGDRTGTLVAGRALKLYDASTIHRFVQSASFTAVTTIALESGTAITSSLTSFAVAALNPVAPSKPQTPWYQIRIGAPQSMSANTATTVIFQGTGAGAVVSNTFSWYSRTTGRFSPQWAGLWNIYAVCEPVTTLPAAGLRVEGFMNGSASPTLQGPRVVTPNSGDTLVAATISGPMQFNGSSDYLEVKYTGLLGNHVLASLSYFQAYYLGK